MRKPPLVLVTTSTQRRGAEFSDVSLSLSQRYSRALVAAGALPWVLPVSIPALEIGACVERCDGIMLTGGDDVQPALYEARLPGRVRRTLGPPDPPRDLLELEIIAAAFARRKPLLAICRGQQILNVALGGTLVADIRSQVPGALDHQCSDRKDQLVHEIHLTAGSLLASISGESMLRVNSSHHQAVARVAKPFRATAVSPDGVVEGLELAPACAPWLPYLLAIQFHPERLWEQYPVFLELFRSFTRVCARRGSRAL